MENEELECNGHATPFTYNVYASYAGGPTEVTAQGIDYWEAWDKVRETRAQKGWEAYMERVE